MSEQPTKPAPTSANQGTAEPVTITKRELAERIAEEHNLGQVQTLAIVQSFLDQIVAELAKGRLIGSEIAA